MASKNRLLEELRILRTIYDFTVAFDTADLDGMLRCFAEDGTWHRHGGTICGHEGVRTLMTKDRPPGLFSRHVISNSRVDFVADDEATCSSYLTVFRLDLPEKPVLPVTFAGDVGLVGQLVDKLRVVDGEWKLFDRRATIEIRQHA